MHWITISTSYDAVGKVRILTQPVSWVCGDSQPTRDFGLTFNVTLTTCFTLVQLQTTDTANLGPIVKHFLEKNLFRGDHGGIASKVTWQLHLTKGRRTRWRPTITTTTMSTTTMGGKESEIHWSTYGTGCFTPYSSGRAIPVYLAVA